MKMTAESPDGIVRVTVEVNGDKHELALDPRRSLADLLRRDLGSTGTRVGCETGACGSCTVLVDGDPVRSCVLLAVQADGARVETVESLSVEGELGELQQAFHDLGALQCGFCTPGFLMLGTAFLRDEPAASRGRIRECVSANLCRCTGYSSIIDAIEAVGQRHRE
jgi:aerobic carbon-monoxide dehydrogenase small subunit